MLGVANVYPSASHPEFGTFSEALFETIASYGVEVQVLAPRSKSRVLRDVLTGKSRGNLSKPKSRLAVYRPGYWSVSTRLVPAGSSLAVRKTAANLRKAVTIGFPWKTEKIDFVHAYFFEAGWACLDVCEKYKIPCFAELGESSFTNYILQLGDEEFNRCLMRFAGLVAVSQDNEAYVRSRCPDIGDKLVHLPNSVNTGVFKPHARMEMRKRLKLPESGRLISFCGHFIERKGPLRVERALEILGNTKGIFVGTGPQAPQGKQAIHAGPVENTAVPLWLSASDVFVLPSPSQKGCAWQLLRRWLVDFLW